MRRLMWISFAWLTCVSTLTLAQQESYTLLLLEFENQSGIDNPLLNSFNDTMSFVLSRQAEGVQVRVIPSADRDALLTRAANTQPDATPLDQALLATELIDADALVTGSYTKQGDLWLMAAQVYHRKGESKARQEIAIQDEAVYGLLDAFPAQLLPQFTGAGSVAITTDSWKAYEEFRKGHEQFEGYNFFGALEHYDRALQLDPTLALAYAEQSYVYFMTGQPELATKAIQTAQEWLPSASPMEQFAIQALVYSWDAENNTYTPWSAWAKSYGLNEDIFAGLEDLVNLAPGGTWDEPLIHKFHASVAMSEGRRDDADRHHREWFEAVQTRLGANPDDVFLLHDAATYCMLTRTHQDIAIDLELRAIEIEPEETWYGKRYVLTRLCEQDENVDQALEWAMDSVQRLPDPRERVEENRRTFYDATWDYLGECAYEGRIPLAQLLEWCEQVLSLPELPLPYHLRTQYLRAELYHLIGEDVKSHDLLASLGVPHEGDWMVIGAFSASEEDLLPQRPLSKLCNQLAGPDSDIFGQQTEWMFCHDGHLFDGSLEISSILRQKYAASLQAFEETLSLAYSCIYVEVPTRVDAQLRTGSGLMKIWLDDDSLAVMETRTMAPQIIDDSRHQISLSAGLNRILVATTSGHWSHDFTFRITDLAGKAIPGLKYVSLKDVLASGP